MADLQFLADILEKSHWLLYGDLDEYFDGFLKRVFSIELKDWGFSRVEMSPDFSVAYWLLISELNALDLVEYGTSPRGAWFTERGERFKRIILENDEAIEKAQDFLANA